MSGIDFLFKRKRTYEAMWQENQLIHLYEYKNNNSISAVKEEEAKMKKFFGGIKADDEFMELRKDKKLNAGYSLPLRPFSFLSSFHAYQTFPFII